VNDLSSRGNREIRLPGGPFPMTHPFIVRSRIPLVPASHCTFISCLADWRYRFLSHSIASCYPFFIDRCRMSVLGNCNCQDPIGPLGFRSVPWGHVAVQKSRVEVHATQVTEHRTAVGCLPLGSEQQEVGDLSNGDLSNGARSIKQHNRTA